LPDEELTHVHTEYIDKYYPKIIQEVK